MNVLFIMADQLRWDHLGCAGHPYLKTPNIDALAQRGVRFANAFVNSGVCGPSRMSFYTGRYPVSHGATWNRVPLSVGEVTLGEMLRGAGRFAGAGRQDARDARRGRPGAAASRGWQRARRRCWRAAASRRSTATTATTRRAGESGYPAFLRARGYDGADPWSDHVISAIDGDGRVASGWHMRNVHLPARVREEHSETAYMTDQAITYVRRMGSQPWVLHLSYVKPHWPYMAPAPYHAMYSADQCLPVVRSDEELRNAHPVAGRLPAAGRMRQLPARRLHPHRASGLPGPDQRSSTTTSDACSSTRAANGRLDDTLIIFTPTTATSWATTGWARRSCSTTRCRSCPSSSSIPRAAADATRGTVEHALRRIVDVVPTVLDALGMPLPAHRLEGASLLPLLHGRPARLARLHLQRARLQLSPRAPGARQGRAPVPCLQPAQRALALCVLARRARAAVRPAGRPGRVPRPRRREGTATAAREASGATGCSTSWPGAGTAPPSPTRRSSAAPARTRRPACIFGQW